MTDTLGDDAPRSHRVRGLLAGAWGVASGIAPHVLHHAGPLAGAALLAGTGGRVLFFFIGLAVTLPMLIRLHRKFSSWWAPAIAIAIFTVAYTVSSLFFGPLFTGEGGTPADPAATTTTDQHGH